MACHPSVPELSILHGNFSFSVESVQIQRHGEFDPWGRPGAGAPLRTRSGHIVADYKNRQVRKASYAGKVMMMY